MDRVSRRFTWIVRICRAPRGMPQGARISHSFERRGPESNRRIAVLQTAALPLGYRATSGALGAAFNL